MKKYEVTESIAEKIRRHREDFQVQFYQGGSHAGGAGHDTSNTAVRIKDKKTGLQVEYSRERSQLQNKTEAFRLLIIKLIRFYQEEERLERAEKMLKSKKVVRTYNENRNQVVDHRLGKSNSFNYIDILDGKFGEVHDKLNLNEDIQT